MTPEQCLEMMEALRDAYNKFPPSTPEEQKLKFKNIFPKMYRKKMRKSNQNKYTMDRKT